MSLATLTSGIQYRDLATLTPTQRDDTTERHTLTAIGVPYGVEITLWDGYCEMFAPGSVDDTGAILRYGHREPLGPIVASKDTPDGRVITAEITPTPRGDEIAAYVDDGVLTRMSIGFDGIEHTVTDRDDGTTLITWTKVRAREYSIVEFPAYDAATITDFRDTTHSRKEPHMTSSTATAPAFASVADLDALRSSLDDLAQSVSLLRTEGIAAKTPPTDRRSIGTVLKDLARGDEETIRSVNALAERAWDGTTTAADATMDSPTWIGDLTRLYNAPDPLKGLFSSGSLPAEGMKLEYAELDANSIQVSEQETEGSDLKLGKLSTKDATTSIKTFGGYTSLSIQAIQRARINVLAHHMTGMTLAAAKADADYFAAQFAQAVKTQTDQAISIAKDAAALKWADLAAMVVDAAAAYTSQALTLDGLIVDKDTFKALASLTGADDRPLMTVTSGANTVGTLNLPKLSGNLVGITVVPNLRQTTDQLGEGVVGTFFNSAALRHYSTNLVQLQDENIINLTKAFSVYRYAAVAAEIPSALVPLKLGA